MKDPGQKRILAVDLSHEGFKDLIHKGIVSNYENAHVSNNMEEFKLKIKNSDVVIQWDPERDILLNKLNYRTIQIGLRNIAVQKYCKEWILDITDVTELSQEIKLMIDTNKVEDAKKLLPKEYIYEINHS